MEYSQEEKERIVEYVLEEYANGKPLNNILLSVTQFGKLQGYDLPTPSRATLYKWIEQNPEWKDKLLQAKKQCGLSILDDIDNMLQKPAGDRDDTYHKDVVAKNRLRIAAIMNPEQCSEKQIVENNINVNVSLADSLLDAEKRTMIDVTEESEGGGVHPERNGAVEYIPPSDK